MRNGYHDIHSLVTFCNLHDIILVSKTNCLHDEIVFSGKFKNGISKDVAAGIFHFLREAECAARARAVGWSMAGRVARRI